MRVSFESVAGNQAQDDDEVQTSEETAEVENQTATVNGTEINILLAAVIIVFKYYDETFRCQNRTHGLLNHMIKE